MPQKSYIVNDDHEYNVAFAIVFLAQNDYPELTEIEVAKKVLDDRQYMIWKETYDKERRLNGLS